MVVRGQGLAERLHRTAERIRDERRRRPEREDRQRRGPRLRAHDQDEEQAGRRDRRAGNHLPDEHHQPGRATALSARRRGLPFEQSAPGDPEAHERDGDRVRHLVRVVGEEGQLQREPDELGLEILDGGPEKRRAGFQARRTGDELQPAQTQR